MKMMRKIDIYIYIERERERERHVVLKWGMVVHSGLHAFIHIALV